MKLSTLIFTAYLGLCLSACQTVSSRDAGVKQGISGAVQATGNRANAPEQGLDQAMNDFISGIVETDEAEILSSFSKNQPWRLVNYDIETAKPYYREDVSYSKMARDWKTRSGWWDFFFEQTDGAMAYRYNFDRGVKWRYKGNNTFVAPDSSSGNTYIKWRKQGENWVVEEIGQTVV